MYDIRGIIKNNILSSTVFILLKILGFIIIIYIINAGAIKRAIG